MKSVKKTKRATFCVLLPDPHKRDMPSPEGTGFFVSPDGYFVSAGHVLNATPMFASAKKPQIVLQKEIRSVSGNDASFLLFGAMPDFQDQRLDFSLLKIAYDENKDRIGMEDRKSFPFIPISTRRLEDGEIAHTFGYPSSDSKIEKQDGVTTGTLRLKPRVTQGIISSSIESTETITTSDSKQSYILDRALVHGNSGGPLVCTETGCAHGWLIAYDTFKVEQPDLSDVSVPSGYSEFISFSNPRILQALSERNVPLCDD